jgi:aryl-alcohol dehydrogenase-like predicted oxidoreductase
LGGGFFQRDDWAASRVVGHALARGITFFDVADNYGYGHAERLLGQLLEGRRSQVVLASKGGYLPSSLARYAKRLLPARRLLAPMIRPFRAELKGASRKRQDFSAAHLRRALEGSLQRLRTDYLDLYQLHSPPRDVLESGEAFETLERFKKEGKIRCAGVSVRSVLDALHCLRHPGVDAIQVAFNLLQPEAAEALLPRAAAQGVGIVARVPLAQGVLTESGRIRAGLRPISAEDEAVVGPRRAEVAALLVDERRTLPQAALRFVLQHRDVATVIAGTGRVEHLEHNLAALEGARALSAAEMERVRALAHRWANEYAGHHPQSLKRRAL